LIEESEVKWLTGGATHNQQTRKLKIFDFYWSGSQQSTSLTHSINQKQKEFYF